ncbi:MAG: hypothetical protein COB30_020425 [Ectothiorhodospiraceae bacterium]|nr:hypothetical protein [Ectothiorhodospiraceae bacterium]
MNNFQSEWAIIHNNIENYETQSLIIKLISALICAYAVTSHISPLFSISLILILWLLDGIWKTFQHRLQKRILLIEKVLLADRFNHNADHHPVHSTDNDTDHNTKSTRAFQLYSQWDAQRKGPISLIIEYCLQSIKPTIAYPYVLFIPLIIIFS